MTYEQLLKYKTLYDELDKESIKERIRDLLAAHNLKAGSLSEILGISNHAAYSYTKKDYGAKPPLYNLLMLAAYFNVDVEYFLR